MYHSSLLEYWSVCCVPFQPIGVLVCVLCTIPAHWSIGLCAVYHSSLLEYWSVCCVPFQPIGVLVCVLYTIPAYCVLLRWRAQVRLHQLLCDKERVRILCKACGGSIQLLCCKIISPCHFIHMVKQYPNPSGHGFANKKWCSQ